MTKSALVRASRVASVAVLTGLLMQTAPAKARAPQQPADAAPVPRDSQGHPDMSGIWVLLGRSSYGPNPFQTETPPYRPDGLMQQQRFRESRGKDDPQGRCLMSGVPRIYSEPFPFKIAQLPDEVLIIHEAFHAARIIPTDGSEHPEYMDPTYMGTSRGRWEGDTLVVDVRGFNDRTWLSRDGTFHSDQLQITERWTMSSPETIEYEAMVTDPVVFTRPFKMWGTFGARPNDQIREYECIEGLPGILPEQYDISSP